MMKPFFGFLVLYLIFSLYACEKHHIARKANHSRIPYDIVLGHNKPICYFDAIMKKNNLVDISKLSHNILIDLKYATTDNFMGVNLYGCLCKAYLQPDVAQRLLLCSDELQKLQPGYTLVILDAARPIQIQKIMWEQLDLPMHEKVKFLSNPAYGSLHNYGAAVDVTIRNSDGIELDMGTPYDYIGEAAHPQLEAKLLNDGILHKEQIDNRNLLRKVMRAGGFWGIQTEWWHFNAMTREQAASRYNLIQ